jgi:hypothetical protein
MLDILLNGAIIILLAVIFVAASYLNLFMKGLKMNNYVFKESQKDERKVFDTPNMKEFTNEIWTIVKTDQEKEESYFFKRPCVSITQIQDHSKMKEKIILPKIKNMWKSKNTFFVLYEIDPEQEFVLRSCVDYALQYYDVKLKRIIETRAVISLVKTKNSFMLCIPLHEEYDELSDIVVARHIMQFVAYDTVYKLLFDPAGSIDFADWNRTTKTF